MRYKTISSCLIVSRHIEIETLQLNRRLILTKFWVSDRIIFKQPEEKSWISKINLIVRKFNQDQTIAVVFEVMLSISLS